MPNDLLAELAEIERIDYVKQSNEANLAPVAGLRVYAGNDDLFARTLDIGEAGGILVASHIVGPQMRRMVDEPENRAAIDASLRDVYRTLFLTASPTCTKAALEMLGHRGGGLRLPMVAADDDRARGGARDARAPPPAPDRRRVSDPARAAARRPRRDRQEHDRRRVRRPDRRRRRRAALPDARRWSASTSCCPTSPTCVNRAADIEAIVDHARPRGPSRRAALGAARARRAQRAPDLRRAADDGDGALQARGAQAARGRADRPRRRRRGRPRARSSSS